MKPIKISSPEEMQRIIEQLNNGEYEKMTKSDQLKAKVVHTMMYTDAFMERFDTVKKLVLIAMAGEDCIKRAMGAIAELYTESTPQNLQEALLEQEDQLKAIKLTAKDPDEGFIRELPFMVRAILEPSEALSNKKKK